MSENKQIIVPDYFNRILAYLTFECNLECFYCHISRNPPQAPFMPTDIWVKGLNKFDTNGLPIILTGGEPTLHPSFDEIVERINPATPLVVQTNLRNVSGLFIKHVKTRFRAGGIDVIKASYHPTQNNINNFINSVMILKGEGFKVAVSILNHPTFQESIKASIDKFTEFGIQVELSDFSGIVGEKFHGNPKFSYGDRDRERIKQSGRSVDCTPSQVIIGPTGGIYTCHYNMLKSDKHYTTLVDITSDINNPFTGELCDDCAKCYPDDITLKVTKKPREECPVEIIPI